MKKELTPTKSVVPNAGASSKKTSTSRNVSNVEPSPSNRIATTTSKTLDPKMRRNDRVIIDLLSRYRAINALHVAYYNRLAESPAELAHEFFYVVGDILEGKPLDALTTRLVDKERVQEFLSEDRTNANIE